MKNGDLLVWWTNERDCRLIGSIYAPLTEDQREDAAPPSWPAYLMKEYQSRYGRNGRGRLWSALEFGAVEVAPWLDTAFAGQVGEYYAGIVIKKDDLSAVIGLPGVITDLSLSPIEPSDMAYQLYLEFS